MVPIFTRKLVRGGGALGETAVDLRVEFSASISSELPPRHARSASAGGSRARSATSGGTGGGGVMILDRALRSASVDSSGSCGSVGDRGHYR